MNDAVLLWSAFLAPGCLFLSVYVPIAFTVHAVAARKFSLQYLFIATTAEAVAIGICRAAWLVIAEY